MKTQTKALFLIGLLAMVLAGFAQAQTKVTLVSGSEFKVDGGSTLHDWHMTTSSAKGEGLFVLDGNLFKGASNVSITFAAETLKSGTSGLDKNAYKALKTDKYRDIKFTLKELTGSGSSFTAKGDLSIAGVTKSVTIPVKLSSSGNKYTFEGSLKTQLTNFSITPPTALMGTVKTEDAITLSFKTIFQTSL